MADQAVIGSMSRRLGAVDDAVADDVLSAVIDLPDSIAIEEAHASPLTVESVCRWHRTLMTGSPTPAQHVGVLRTEQGWIGGTSRTSTATTSIP